MNNTKDHKEEDFALYTERIEPKPSVKYRKLIRGGEFVLAAIVFGVIASMVMLLVYPALAKRADKDDLVKEQLTIQKDKYPSEEDDTKEKQEDSTLMSEDTGHVSEVSVALQRTTANILKSMVTIDVYRTEVNSILMETNSTTDTSGIVIGQINGQFIILTNYTAIKESSLQVVKFSAATEVSADLLGYDEAAGIALLGVKENALSSSEKAGVVVAQLDNSYKVKQGDLVFAAGKLYGQKKSVNCGIVTAISSKSGIDNSYGVLHTGIACKEGDYGYLFNEEGNVVGITFTEEQEHFTAVGISDLKYMIQELSNNRELPYYGIRGQNVTSTMAVAYGLPMGIYITEVMLDSPAYMAGLQQGDIITAVDSNMVLTIQSFSEKLYQYDKDSTMTVSAKRLGKDGYKEMEFTAEIQSR